MKRPFRIRVLGFGLASVLVVALIGWAQHASWRQLDRLRQTHDAVRIDSFSAADHVKVVVLGLNDTLLQFDFRQKPDDQARFRRDSQALQIWMGSNVVHLHTATERELMGHIQSAFQTYLANAEGIMAESARLPGSDLSVVFQESAKQSADLLALCDRLVTAHRAALAEFVTESREGIVGLQHLLLIRLCVSLALAAALAVLVYRGMFAPLRTQLVESHAIIERQEKLTALGALAAGVAHEIRNPLTAINVRLHTLSRAVRADASASEDVTVIGEEIARLDRIVKDFLKFARPSEPHLAVMPADRLLQELHGLLQPQLAKNAIELKLDLRSTDPVRVDPQQIKQVLINLVQNAADSIVRHGTITLRTRADSLPLGGRRTPVVVLEVSDTGQGIPPGVQNRLFDPFFTTKEGGTGLGLSIAARIVRNHGGALQFQTEPGRGTTFGVVLPGTPVHEAQNPPH